ncbi:FAD:protein FMN transferase [Neisseriaceae bacterium PsAf]|nr:FAD:protein FMN transferase [Neisseriaceae bacterium PsAf]
MRPLLRLFIYGVVALLLLSVGSCDSNNAENSLKVTNGRTMGTTYVVNYDGEGISPQQVESINQNIQQIVDNIDGKMSTYDNQSELSQFNQSKKVSEPFYISDETAKVIQEATRLNELTHGTLDITIGPLVNLWGFGPEKKKSVKPSVEEVSERKKAVGMNLFVLSKDIDGRYYLLKEKPEVYLDLSSIAKGFAVDEVAQYLDQQSIKNYLIEIGGEIKAKGYKNKNKPWEIAIEKPSLSGKREIAQVIDLKYNSLATSGSYRNYYELDGQFYNHEIDPRTGYPTTSDILSVSVIHPSNMTADGLATGLVVMNSQDAIALADELDIPILMITKDENGKIKEVYSEAFVEFIREK